MGLPQHLRLWEAPDRKGARQREPRAAAAAGDRAAVAGVCDRRRALPRLLRCVALALPRLCLSGGTPALTQNQAAAHGPLLGMADGTADRTLTPPPHCAPRTNLTRRQHGRPRRQRGRLHDRVLRRPARGSGLRRPVDLGHRAGCVGGFGFHSISYSGRTAAACAVATLQPPVLCRAAAALAPRAVERTRVDGAVRVPRLSLI